jgi:hypothetical protein
MSAHDYMTKSAIFKLLSNFKKIAHIKKNTKDTLNLYLVKKNPWAFVIELFDHREKGGK